METIWWDQLASRLGLKAASKGNFCAFTDTEDPYFSLAAELQDEAGNCFGVCIGHLGPIIDDSSTSELLLRSLLAYNDFSGQLCFFALDDESPADTPVIKCVYRFFARWDDESLIQGILYSALHEMRERIRAHHKLWVGASGRNDAVPAAQNAESQQPRSRHTKMVLRDIEPSNIPPVSNHDAALFMRHLTGRETFEWTGIGAPRSYVIFDLTYAYPRVSTAIGWLMATDLETLDRAGFDSNFFKQQVIGKITIEFGGNHPETIVHAMPLEL